MGVCHGNFKAAWHPGALRWLNGDVPMQFHHLRSRLRSGCNMLQPLRPYNPWAQEDSPYHPRLVAYLAIPPWQHLPVVPCTTIADLRIPSTRTFQRISCLSRSLPDMWTGRSMPQMAGVKASLSQWIEKLGPPVMGQASNTIRIF